MSTLPDTAGSTGFCERFRRLSGLAGFVVSFVLGFGAFSGDVIAQEEIQESAGTVAGESAGTAGGESDGPAGGESAAVDRPDGSTPGQALPAVRKRQTAIAGLLVLGLVCFVFLMLILGVILWGRRVRRRVDQPLPDQHPGDPLWYLRRGNRSEPTDDEHPDGRV